MKLYLLALLFALCQADLSSNCTLSYRIKDYNNWYNLTHGMYFGLYDSLKPMLLGEDASVLLSFLLGWGVTITAGLMSYPIDTIRRRMMMTSGAAVKYNGSIDCGVQILKNEGFMSMMKGAGANVLRGVAGAGVLAGFDKFKEIYVKWRLANA